jgi:alpha-ketoglutarate-dependent taurine dioxygenase
MKFEPLTAHMGAHVVGLDLTAPLSRETDALRDALYRYRILLFRQGPISAEDHIRLMNSIGHVIVEHSSGKPVTYVSPLKVEQVLNEGSRALLFHSEYQFTRHGPIQALSLYAEACERDEPTLFADMAHAAKSIPNDLRQRLASLEVINCCDFSTGGREYQRYRMSEKRPEVLDAEYPSNRQPLLAHHPVTHEQFINVSPLFTSHIVGMDDEQSDAIFAQIHPYQFGEAANRYAHRWQPHDLVIWDNWTLQHGRDALQLSAGRKLRRVVINPVDLSTVMSGIRATALPNVKNWESAGAVRA